MRYQNKKFKFLRRTGIIRGTLVFAMMCAVLTVAQVVRPVFADETSKTGVNAVVRETISVGITSNNVVLNMDPGSSSAFSSGSSTVHVYTNAMGYKLYISSKTSETALTNAQVAAGSGSDYQYAISALTTYQTTLDAQGITTDLFPDNSWGYSLDGTGYFGVKGPSDPIKFKETTNWDEIGDSATDIYFGVKVNSSMASGTYKNSMVITAEATLVPPYAPVVPDVIGWTTSATITPEAILGNHAVQTYEYIVTQDADFVPADDSAVTGSGMELTLDAANGYSDGIYYIFFRAVDMVDSRSAWSDRVTVKLDNTVPDTNFATTNNLNAASQTATLTCNNTVGVQAYYFGTKETPEDGDFIEVSDDTQGNKPTNWTSTETIDQANTYRLVCKSTTGVSSDPATKTYYTYKVSTLLDTLAGTAGTYTNANYEMKTAGTQYIAVSGTNIDPAAHYAVPSPFADATRYRGTSTSYSASAAALSTDAVALNSNLDLYSWFDRFTYQVELTKGEGIASVTGAGTYKHGADVSINAAVSTGYTWSKWLRNGTEWSTTQNATISGISEDYSLTASAGDSAGPTVSNVTRLTTVGNYDKFTFVAADGVGLASYCITTGSDSSSCSWTTIRGTSQTITGTLAGIGTNRIYAKDAAGNVSTAGTITGYQVAMGTVTDTTLTVTLNGGTVSSFPVYVTAGTPMVVNATPQVGTLDYIKVSGVTITAGAEIALGSSYVVNNVATITAASKALGLGSVKFLDEVTAEVCAATPDYSTSETTYRLIDRRGGTFYAYQVRKIRDRCWMVQNLALPGGATYAGTYSNLPSASSTIELPASSTSGWSSNTTKYVYNGTHIGQGDTSGNITTAPQADNTSTNTGAYYSYPVAAATEHGNQTTNYYDTLYSICPRNWRLPSFVDNNGATTVGADFKSLTDDNLTAFGSWNMNALNSTSFGLFQNAYTSYCNSGGCPFSSNLGTYSFWWSSTVASSTAARRLGANSSDGLYADNNARRSGHSVRCVIRAAS